MIHSSRKNKIVKSTDDKNSSHKNINHGRIRSSKYQNSSSCKRMIKGSKEATKSHTCCPKKLAYFQDQVMIPQMSKRTFKRQILRNCHR